MRKNAMRLLFAFVFIFALFAFTALFNAEEEQPLTSGPFEYTVDEDGNATITAYTSQEPNVDIPAEIVVDEEHKHPVTVIGENAFKNSYAQVVTVPDSVKRIEAYAFSGSALNQITLGKNVEFIGNQAFSYTALTSIDIPDSVVTMDTTIFWHCETLEDVTIGDSVESIGDYCFEACYMLSDITLPDSLKTLGNYAFFTCDGLKTITFGAGLQTIGNNCFESCTSLEEVMFYPHLKSIGSEAFKGCENLYKATFDCDAPQIGENAFDGVNEIFKIYYADCASGWDSKDLSGYSLEEVQMHVFGDWQVQTAPTTDTLGVEARTCSGCGEVEQRTIDMLPSDGQTQNTSAWVPYVVAGTIIVVIAAFIVIYLICARKKKLADNASK